MNDFVVDRNVTLFLDKLSAGDDPSLHSTLLKLLVDEESKLGRSREQLDKAEEHVRNGKARIAGQRALIAGQALEGRALEQSQALLRTLEATQELLERHYTRMLQEVDRRQL